MLEKKKNKFNQKSYQRGNDKEDRSLPYRNWMRTVLGVGYWMDIDFIKWKKENGRLIPAAITEITRCDSDNIGQKYLDAVYHRFFVRDKQGESIEELSILLGVPAYLVIFQKEMKWCWVWSFQLNEWQKFTAEEWGKYISRM